MKYKNIEVYGQRYKWSSKQDSQHPDFVLICNQGEIWVSVEDTYDEQQCNLYISGKTEFPVSLKTAQLITSQILKKGYIESYFLNTDIGLVLSETGSLEEN